VIPDRVVVDPYFATAGTTFACEYQPIAALLRGLHFQQNRTTRAALARKPSGTPPAAG
jgi:hypothetical protein